MRICCIGARYSTSCRASSLTALSLCVDRLFLCIGTMYPFAVAVDGSKYLVHMYVFVPGIDIDSAGRIFSAFSIDHTPFFEYHPASCVA